VKISAAQQPRERCRAGVTHLHAGLAAGLKTGNRSIGAAGGPGN
jgi:hypothetical protein